MSGACQSECSVIRGIISHKVLLDHRPVTETMGTFVQATYKEITLLHLKMIAIRLQTHWKTDYTNLLLFIMCFWVGKLNLMTYLD